MERMIVFCLFLFCSSMLLAAAAPTRTRYMELIKTVNELKKIIKVKDGEHVSVPENSESKCMSSLKCFQQASSYLEYAKDQSKHDFKIMIKRLQRSMNTTDLNCSPCKSYAKEAPRNFLNSFLSLLQEQIRKLSI